MYPINSFEEDASHQNRTASSRLQKKHKHDDEATLLLLKSTVFPECTQKMLINWNMNRFAAKSLLGSSHLLKIITPL